MADIDLGDAPEANEIDLEQEARPEAPKPRVAPVLYDQAEDDDAPAVPIVSAALEGVGAAKDRKKVRSGEARPAEQLAIDIPGYEPGVWKLPARDVLKKSTRARRRSS